MRADLFVSSDARRRCAFTKVFWNGDGDASSGGQFVMFRACVKAEGKIKDSGMSGRVWEGEKDPFDTAFRTES